MKKQFFCLLALATIGLAGCKEDPKPENPPVTSSVLVANEGAFQGGTGSITAYSTGAKTTEKNMFQKANLISVGNILNEIYIDRDRTFLSINVSGDVVMCNTTTLKVEARFENLGSPRKVIHVSGDKYYSTDWASNVVHVLDAKTKKVLKSIPTGLGPESMVVVDGIVYVTNSGGFTTDNTIFMIDAEKDAVVDSIVVPDNPIGIVHDKYNKLWILCSGKNDFTDPSASTPANLVSYSLDSSRIERVLPFTIQTKKPLRLVIDGTGENMYYLDNGYDGDLYKMSTADSILPLAPFQAGTFYGLGYDKVNDEIYVSDPLDFTVNGDVYRFGKDGNLIDQFKGGLIPSTFGFR